MSSHSDSTHSDSASSDTNTSQPKQAKQPPPKQELPKGLQRYGMFYQQFPNEERRNALLDSLEKADKNMEEYKKTHRPYAPVGPQLLGSSKTPEEIREAFLRKQEEKIRSESSIVKQIKKENEYKQQQLAEKQKYEDMQKRASEIEHRNNLKKQEEQEQRRMEILKQRDPESYHKYMEQKYSTENMDKIAIQNPQQHEFMLQEKQKYEREMSRLSLEQQFQNFLNFGGQ